MKNENKMKIVGGLGLALILAGLILGGILFLRNDYGLNGEDYHEREAAALRAGGE